MTRKKTSEDPESKKAGSASPDGPFMYVTEEACSALVYLPDPPLALWLGLPDVWLAVPAWLLTPAIYARVWWQCVKVEDRWAAGDYPSEKIAEVWRRWAIIDEYASAHLDLAELDRCKRLAASNSLPPIPRPGPRPSTPFDWRIVCEGAISKWQKVDV